MQTWFSMIMWYFVMRSCNDWRICITTKHGTQLWANKFWRQNIPADVQANLSLGTFQFKRFHWNIYLLHQVDKKLYLGHYARPLLCHLIAALSSRTILKTCMGPNSFFYLLSEGVTDRQTDIIVKVLWAYVSKKSKSNLGMIRVVELNWKSYTMHNAILGRRQVGLKKCCICLISLS